MKTCSKAGCGKPATKLPVMTFTAVVAPLGQRAEGHLDLPVCDEHASIDPKAYITDEGWRAICGKMAHAGKARPDRSSVRIHFKPLLGH